jgi:predicted O-methyltransferase YrrM
MDSRIERILGEYEARHEREREVWSRLSDEEIGKRLDEFLFCVGPRTGALLNLLIREAGARTILELGTAYGYSTLWLAEAARVNGGRVISVELSQEKIDCAGEALGKAGLLEYVELRRGDALEMLAGSEEEYDFVLLDIWKDLYIPCFDACLPRLEPGAIVVADNMLDPPSVGLQALRYRKHVRAVREIESVLLPVGAGLYVSRYRVR